jgi:hypothetical protein
MPGRLSLRFTLLLVAVAFGLTVAVPMLLGGGSSAAAPAAKQGAQRSPVDAPGAEPNLRLAAAGTVPALRDPRQPRKRHVRTHKPARKPAVRRVVRAAPRVQRAPVVPAPTARPEPTAAPRYVPPAPRYVAPVHHTKPAAPKPTPAPTAPPASGEFDTTGGS